MSRLDNSDVREEVSDMLRELYRKAGQITDHPEEHAAFVDGFNLFNDKERLLLAVFGELCYEKMKRWGWRPLTDDPPIGAPFHDD